MRTQKIIEILELTNFGIIGTNQNIRILEIMVCRMGVDEQVFTLINHPHRHPHTLAHTH